MRTAAEALEDLRNLADAGPVTLVTATRQVQQSHLGVLNAVLEQR